MHPVSHEGALAAQPLSHSSVWPPVLESPCWSPRAGVPVLESPCWSPRAGVSADCLPKSSRFPPLPLPRNCSDATARTRLYRSEARRQSGKFLNSIGCQNRPPQSDNRLPGADFLRTAACRIVTKNAYHLSVCRNVSVGTTFLVRIELVPKRYSFPEEPPPPNSSATVPSCRVVLFLAFRFVRPSPLNVPATEPSSLRRSSNRSVASYSYSMKWYSYSKPSLLL